MSRLILRRSRIRPIVFWTFLCRTNPQPRPAKYLKPLCIPNHHKLSTHTKIHLSLYEQLTHLATLKHLIAPQYQSPHPINHSQPTTNKKSPKKMLLHTHRIHTHTHTKARSRQRPRSASIFPPPPPLSFSLSLLACLRRLPAATCSLSRPQNPARLLLPAAPPPLLAREEDNAVERDALLSRGASCVFYT